MERKIFVLTTTKDFRRSVRVFLKAKDGKIDARRIVFTTEHKVSEKDRNVRARGIPAEYSTSDEVLYDALLRSTAYGKTWIEKGDTELKLKREPFDITPMDAKKMALKNFFEQAGINFDGSKSNEVLEQEYQIHANAKAGTKIKGSAPAEIPHTPVNVAKQREEQVNAAQETYFKRYGKDIPDDFANDTALLSALSADPKFDAETYIENARNTEDSPKNGPIEDSIEDLRAKYFEKFQKNVSNPKKNDAAWIKKKLEEE